MFGLLKKKKTNAIGNTCVPVGGACRVRPAEGELVPHPTAVQANSTKV